jgi:phage-related minor tail protein
MTEISLCLLNNSVAVVGNNLCRMTMQDSPWEEQYKFWKQQIENVNRLGNKAVKENIFHTQTIGIH